MIDKREEIAKTIAACILVKYKPVFHWDFYDLADQILSLIVADDQAVELLSNEEIWQIVAKAYGKNEVHPSCISKSERKIPQAQASKMIKDGWFKSK